MNLTYKFNISRIEDIEKTKGAPIQEVIGDTTVANIILLTQKAGVKEDGTIGMSRASAIKALDEYLETNDITDVVLDITEGLMNAGFLSREMNIQAVREQKAKAIAEAQKQFEEAM